MIARSIWSLSSQTTASRARRSDWWLAVEDKTVSRTGRLTVKTSSSKMTSQTTRLCRQTTRPSQISRWNCWSAQRWWPAWMGSYCLRIGEIINLRSLPTWYFCHWTLQSMLTTFRFYSRLCLTISRSSIALCPLGSSSCRMIWAHSIAAEDNL